jgi:hypothetical protein
MLCLISVSADLAKASTIVLWRSSSSAQRDTAAQKSATQFYKGLHGGRVDAALQEYLA